MHPAMWKSSEEKGGRGTHAYKTDLKTDNSGMSVLRWFDSTCVQMFSSYSDAAPSRGGTEKKIKKLN